MINYVEKAEFPELVVKKLKRKDLLRTYLKQPHGDGQNLRKLITIILELS